MLLFARSLQAQRRDVLHTFHARSCRLAASGVGVLLAGLQGCRSLTSLDLSNNRLGEEGGALIARVIMDKPIKTLLLGREWGGEGGTGGEGGCCSLFGCSYYCYYFVGRQFVVIRSTPLTYLFIIIIRQSLL